MNPHMTRQIDGNGVPTVDEGAIRELRAALDAMNIPPDNVEPGTTAAPFNYDPQGILEEGSKKLRQQRDMENWVDHMTKPKLFNFYDESDGNASRSL